MTQWTDRIGKRNPQFLRECRGRLKSRNVIAAIVLSLIFQFLLYISVAGLGGEIVLQDQRSVCQALSWIMPYVLFVLGGFYIVDDLTKEERTGTLNFIRLSPRPAQEILLGKLLGVPLLPVILALTAVPLHVISGLLGGASALWFLSYYGVLAFGTAFVYTLALLFGFVGSASPFGKQQALNAIAFAGLALVIITPIFMAWNTFATWEGFKFGSALYTQPYNGARAEPFVQWLYLPIVGNLLIAHLFTLGNLAIGTFVTWRVLLRTFRIPQATLLSKRISYLIVAYLNMLLWGFFQNNLIQSSEGRILGFAAAAFALNVAIAFLLIFAIAPTRQTLIDWSRARGGSILDWVWNDNSPSVLSILISAAIAGALIVPWILIVDRGEEVAILPMILATLSLGTCALIYATIVQLIFSSKLRAPFVWAIGTVATIAAVPPIFLGVLDIGTYGSMTAAEMAIWTFFGLPFGIANQSGMESAALGIGIGWALQIVVLLILLSRLARSLKQLSERRAIAPR
ncbi:MAG: hypothetical protein DCF25_07765 [Leptolyngbya foveolarum]|uniref:ABC transporter permease n=1 Tax=Leptolyngbya foveolarum TaxID=47253 RepID=A0A2W4W660_9CYAN|nr:MAG: hypothetical protein DCF25_07765 [Leptolyngbya foveolarum]